MIAAPTNPIATALFLVGAMSVAGFVHVCWLRSSWARQFTLPIDGEICWRGRRVFGKNKMWRGLVVLPPSTAIVFALLGQGHNELPQWLAQGMWDMSVLDYAVLGFVCGLAFMLAELPNSFVKRQLNTQPGEVPEPPWRYIFMVIDRVDSVIGVLIVASLLVPIPWITWLLALCLGLTLHSMFSLLLYRAGIKARGL